MIKYRIDVGSEDENTKESDKLKDVVVLLIHDECAFEDWDNVEDAVYFEEKEEL